MSRVRACSLVGLNRSSLNYQSKRPDDSPLRQRLRELAAEGRRFGYRRLGWLLAREGHVMNRKKLYRIYREENSTKSAVHVRHATRESSSNEVEKAEFVDRLALHRARHGSDSTLLRSRLPLAHRLRTSVRCRTQLTVPRPTAAERIRAAAGGGENRRRTGHDQCE
jgi:hypothetical protein